VFLIELILEMRRGGGIVNTALINFAACGAMALAQNVAA
jgi:hypothetical protein